MIALMAEQKKKLSWLRVFCMLGSLFLTAVLGLIFGCTGATVGLVMFLLVCFAEV